MSIKDRLIQFVLRGKDELSPEAKKSAEALGKLQEEAERLGKALDSAKDAQGLAKGLEATRRAAEQAERTLVQTDLQIKELRDALNKNPEAAGLQQSLKDAEREGRRLQGQLGRLKDGLAEQEKAATEAGIDTGKLADEHQRLGTEVAAAKQKVSENAAELKTLEREQSRASRAAAEHSSRIESVRNGMGRAGRQVLAFAAAYVSLSAAFGLAQKGLNLVRDGIYSMLGTGDEFAKLDKQMASLMGSVAGGEQATAWIKQFAKDTPLELQDVTQAFALLKSYGIDPMDGTLQALVDKNEQLGGGFERLTGLSQAVGQAFAKQKLQTEEILQLIERGVPVWGLLEKVTGKTTAQLQDLASQGKLGRDVIKALMDEIGASAKGAAAQNMSELSGLVSNFSDTWTDFLSRVAKSGALDYVKQQLKGVADYIDAMDKNGTLDRVAKGLSDAFIAGAEKAKELTASIREIDFAELAGKAEGAVERISSAVETATTAGRYVIATLDAVWNGFSAAVTASAAVITKAVQLTVGNVALAAGQIAGFFGGDELKSKAEGLYGFLGELSTAYADQAKTDLGQVADSFDITVQKAKQSAQEQIDAASAAANEQIMFGQAAADHFIANQDRMKQAALDAVLAGTAALADMAEATKLIDTAQSIDQLEGLRRALLAAYQDGRLSQEQYAQASGVLNAKLKDLGKTAGGAADLVSDLDDALGDLSKVQDAISSAKTDVDIAKIRAALKKLYDDGAITAEQYNAEVKKAAERQRELKKEIDAGTKATKSRSQADKEAADQLRSETADARQDAAAATDFFGSVLSRAREPLAALSAAALDVFDKLRGIKKADIGIDTSSLESTQQSLERVNKQLGDLQAAAARPMSSLGKWALETQQSSLNTQKAFLGEKAQLQSLLEEYEKGGMSAKSFIKAAQGARASLSLLDDADLSSLESAIASAQQRMEQMASSTRSTLESLQDELDGLQGRQEEIDRRRFAARQRELQAQMEEANASGDMNTVSNLQRSISVLKQIQSETEQQRQREQQQKRIDTQQKSQPTPAAQPAKVIRLELAGRKSVDVSVASASDETALLSLLEDVSKRSL
jgi:tape measure domain-containing protein